MQFQPIGTLSQLARQLIGPISCRFSLQETLSQLARELIGQLHAGSAYEKYFLN
jgi:hypothetical protein